jgi:hypothetical protein
MSIFDRKKPLKTIKRYLERFFVKSQSERLDYIDTTRTSNISIIGGGDTNSTGGWGDTSPRDGGQTGWTPFISDADNDTIVDTEKSADEDKIRFDTGGSERFRMEGNDTNGGALYLKEGSGTTAPSTPASGEGVIYEKNDGKLYFKNDAGTETDLTSGGGGGGAPTDAQYVTLATDGDLSDERVLTAGDRITLTDGGAGSTITVASAQQRVIVSHTWALGGQVQVASGDTDFIIPMTVRDRYTSSGYNTTVKIVSVIASINSGTNVTWKLTKNGSDLTGYGTSGSPLTATATPATTESTQTLADKDELAPVVVAISGTPRNMSITAFLEITAA